MKTLLITAFVSVLAIPTVSPATAKATFTDTPLLLFGGEKHDVFLGCLNCSESDQSSVCSSFGKYGGSYDAESIWSTFSQYGGTFSQNSWRATFSSSGPIILDKDGNFYGIFTVNKSLLNRTTVPILVRYLDFAAKAHGDDGLREAYCGLIMGFDD